MRRLTRITKDPGQDLGSTRQQRKPSRISAYAAAHVQAEAQKGGGFEWRTSKAPFPSSAYAAAHSDPAGWPAAGSVDTVLSLHRLFLEGHWAEIAQLRMTSLRVVEALDVVEHIGAGVAASAVDLAGGPLGLER